MVHFCFHTDVSYPETYSDSLSSNFIVNLERRKIFYLISFLKDVWGVCLEATSEANNFQFICFYSFF